MDAYSQFLASKAPQIQRAGIEPRAMPGHLFDFQQAVVDFSVRQGRAGCFLDTGLGKGPVQLEFLRQGLEATNGRALLLAPLVVAQQFKREAEKFGYEAHYIRDQSEARSGINICNYDRLGLLDADAFGAVSLDESAILKNLSGKQSQALISAFSRTRFRLAATATPAPNDHMELGQHAAFLGQMSSQEMLSRWFINDTSTASQSWRLKRSAVQNFWDWVAGWARAAQTPEDLGFDGSRFRLPALNIIRHHIETGISAPAGSLFFQDVSATSVHDLKRQTSRGRAEKAAAIIASEPGEQWLIWVDTDYESQAVADAIADSHEVRGSHSPERKEDTILGFVNGGVRRLITKPGIAGAGVNLQNCARVLYVGRSFSYESWYQSVRRCWRFGQTRQVDVHLIVAEGEDQIGRVIDRKAADHDVMKRAMAAAMRRGNRVEGGIKLSYNPTHITRLPSWMKSAA